MIGEEALAEMTLVYYALQTLHRKNQNWGSNLSVFNRMSNEEQLRWWRRVQKQVDLGLLSMQPLVIEVIKQKMIG